MTEAAEKYIDNDIYDEVINNPVCYEDPKNTVNISIDEVNVKKQEEMRQKVGSSEEKKRKYVHNTVVHVSKGGENYTLNTYGIKAVLCFFDGLYFQ